MVILKACSSNDYNDAEIAGLTLHLLPGNQMMMLHVHTLGITQRGLTQELQGYRGTGRYTYSGCHGNTGDTGITWHRKY